MQRLAEVADRLDERRHSTAINLGVDFAQLNQIVGPTASMVFEQTLV